jgi:carbon monoxide dehydrogenase subunit G
VVWAALNDPEILKQCIPGCQSLDMSSPTEMAATVVFKVGPVKATFGGKVTFRSRSAQQLPDFGRGLRRRCRLCKRRRHGAPRSGRA